MGSEQIHVVDPSLSTLVKLWIFALAGLVVPMGVAYFWPDMSWAGQAERALERSITESQWQDPWKPIDQKTFSSGWVRCTTLEDALALDRKVDDGHLFSGKLILAKGGVAWLPN